MATVQFAAQPHAPNVRIIRVTTSERGEKFFIKCPYNEQIKEFIRSLPGATWSKRRNLWTCDATPACAWRICNNSLSDIEIHADSTFNQLADNFRMAVFNTYHHEGEQPAMRQFDSWAHQCDAYWFAERRHAALLSMYMGTGKSKVAVDLIVNKNCKRVLILCPVSVRGVWRREMAKWTNQDSNFSVLVLEKGSTRKKQEKADEFLALCEARNESAVVVVNYETAWLNPFDVWSLRQAWDAVVLDESHKIKSHSGKCSKFCYELGKVPKYKLCLTGTPMPHSPMDLFGQYRFLDPGIFGTSWPRFRNKYAVIGHFGADHIVAYKNEDELADKMGWLAFEVGPDVLDLPEAIHDTRVADLTPKARRIYDALENEMIAEIDLEGESATRILTASNTLVKLLRLQQLTSGSIPLEPEHVEVIANPETGELEYLEPPEPELVQVCDQKKKMLEELLDGIPPDEPVVVFCKFKQDLETIKEITEKRERQINGVLTERTAEKKKQSGEWRDYTYGELSGKSRDLTPDATMPEHISVMGVQIQSGGVGIDLTRARYVIYYSVGYSLGDYLQSLARAHRPGQERTVFFYHLVMSGTVDEAVYKALEKRQDIVEGILDYLREKQGIEA